MMLEMTILVLRHRRSETAAPAPVLGGVCKNRKKIEKMCT